MLARPLATAGRGRAEAEDPARAGERFTYEALAGRLGDAEIAPEPVFPRVHPRRILALLDLLRRYGSAALTLGPFLALPLAARLSTKSLICGRGGVIRTRDPLLPKQMRYQAAPRPAG